ncbi:NAD(P)-dependent oxidoreductase [Glutamicibacter sp. NPDC087344]|uniref:NAD(P)-dependent oxidoreductase n=1 Tax=Glutamicibacter sp. NPDC087344 TaxID=3363994 RepID=UPI0038055366
MNHHESGATPRVGMIGLGKMGRPMARRLAVGGQHVVLTSTRGKQQVLTDLAADSSLSTGSFEWADSAAELAATCHEIVLMLPDLPQIINYLEAPDGLLTGLERRPANSPPLLLIIGATCSAVGVKNLATELEGRFGGRVVLVDAPVSGGEDGAIQGSLSIMLGGDHDACVRARAVLAPCGTPVRLGELGAGQVAKACNQLVVGATMFALGEASVLAERSGLDLAAMWRNCSAEVTHPRGC